LPHQLLLTFSVEANLLHTPQKQRATLYSLQRENCSTNEGLNMFEVGCNHFMYEVINANARLWQQTFAYMKERAPSGQHSQMGCRQTPF
jgi:hypothetical protein